MDDLVVWFEHLGYRIACRAGAWHECLLQHGDERWLGVGLDRASSIADAISKALPSAAARQAVASALNAGVWRAPEAGPDTEAVAQEAEGREDTPAGASLEAQSASVAQVAPTDELGLAPLEAPAPDASAGIAAALPHEPGLHSVPDPDAQACPGPEIDTPAPAFVPSPPAGAVPHLEDGISAPFDPAVAHDELDALDAAIADNFVEAALLVADRQRLLLTQWIARARAVQEEAEYQSEIEERVRGVARRLGMLAKVWWPGSVKALQLYSRPSDCCDGLIGMGSRRPETWRDLEHAAVEALEQHETKGVASGWDEFGWCDAGELEPGPSDPGDMLKQLVEELDAMTLPPVRAAEAELHANTYRARIKPGVHPPEAVLKDLAGKLRWLRGHVDDFAIWGAAMGRLRWLAQECKVACVPLFPQHRPGGKWTVVLGYQKRQRRQQFVELAASVPAADSPAGVIEAWLGKVFGLEDAVTKDELERLCRPLRERLANIPEREFGNRSARRRYRRLLASLGLRVQGASAASEAESPVVELAAEPVAPRRPPGAELLINPLRAHTKGKRVLVVSNRQDHERDELLRRELGFVEVDACSIEPARVDNKARAVRGGGYDLVLAATGFLPHKIDGVLAKACRARGVPYVRINRGRLGQALLHLARHFGLTRRYGGVAE
ncbi:MAG: hypothetical protein ACKOCB_05705 [Planctomycetia bacterium]